MSLKYAILLIIITVIAFFSGYWINGNKTQYKNTTDTVKVLIPAEISKDTSLKDVKAKHSTIYTYITVKDSVNKRDSIPVAVAYVDTTITDSVSTIKLSVKYYNKPLDSFDIKSSINYKFYKDSIFITNNIEPIEKWFNKIHLGAGLGFSITNEMKIYPSVTIGVYYKIW